MGYIDIYLLKGREGGILKCRQKSSILAPTNWIFFLVLFIYFLFISRSNFRFLSICSSFFSYSSLAFYLKISSSSGTITSILWHPTHWHLYEHLRPLLKHSQYFFLQWVFLQVQPFLYTNYFSLVFKGSYSILVAISSSIFIPNPISLDY